MRSHLAPLLAVLLAAPLAAQERPPITPALRPFVAVDASVVALTHARLVDGTGAPARDDQTILITVRPVRSIVRASAGIDTLPVLPTAVIRSPVMSIV